MCGWDGGDVGLRDGEGGGMCELKDSERHAENADAGKTISTEWELTKVSCWIDSLWAKLNVAQL